MSLYLDKMVLVYGKNIHWCYRWIHNMLYSFPVIFNPVIKKLVTYINYFHANTTYRWEDILIHRKNSFILTDKFYFYGDEDKLSGFGNFMSLISSRFHLVDFGSNYHSYMNMKAEALALTTTTIAGLPNESEEQPPLKKQRTMRK